jgi:hypothetical protein
MQRNDREYIYGQLAVEAGRIREILPDNKISWEAVNEDDVTIAKNDIEGMLDTWQHQLIESALVVDEVELNSQSSNQLKQPEIMPISDLSISRMLEIEKGDTDCIMATDIDNLNEDQ